MPDEGRDVSDIAGPDQALARELAELGPLMRRQEQLEAEEPDPTFARDLRARLIGAASAAPDPAFARDLRARLVRGAAPAVDRRRGRRRTIAWLGLAALIAAFLAGVIIRRAYEGPRLPGTRGSMVAEPPLPSAGDLTRGYPPIPWCCGGGGGGGGGFLAPEQSRLAWIGGNNGPYPGRIHIAGGARLKSPTSVRAYRLRGPSFDAPRIAPLARALGIAAHPARVVYGSARWVEAADGANSPLTKPLHSLAVSTITGELVYHDERTCQTRRGQPPLTRARAVAIARTWLTRLGWPGQQMPVQAALPQGAPAPGFVAFGWERAVPTTTAAATLSIGDCGRVVDAQVWPPLDDRAIPVPARPIGSYAALLQRGNAPVAVTLEGALTRPISDGDGWGTIDQVSMVHVFTAGLDGTLYLAPAYRLAGPARVQIHLLAQPGTPGRTVIMKGQWYTLLPAQGNGP